MSEPVHRPSIRPLSTDEWRAYKCLRLQALESAPDAFSSTLAAAEERNDENWKRQVYDASHSSWQQAIVAEVDDKLVGLAWVRIRDNDAGTADLFQMWVTPEHRHCGIGRAILNAIVDWCRLRSLKRLELRVNPACTHAVQLYANAGFTSTGEFEPIRPGSVIKTEKLVLVLERNRTR